MVNWFASGFFTYRFGFVLTFSQEKLFERRDNVNEHCVELETRFKCFLTQVSNSLVLAVLLLPKRCLLLWEMKCREDNRVTPAIITSMWQELWVLSSSRYDQANTSPTHWCGIWESKRRFEDSNSPSGSPEASSLSGGVDLTQKILKWRNIVLHIITYDFLIYLDTLETWEIEKKTFKRGLKVD